MKPFIFFKFTSDNSRPKELVTGFEPALVDVDGQGHDRAAVEARVRESEHCEVELADVKRHVVEKPNADVAVFVDCLAH